jgi:polyisoprenyl-phosphate glycosyltransferase
VSVKTLSVIVPVHNDHANVAPFYERAKPVLEKLGLDWEIVYVNDGSTDESLAEIRKLREAEPRVKAITLSRNFGYHAALVAGLSSRDSSLYAIIDVDCEDPPELLERFYEEIRGGAQAAYGDRSQRDEPAWIVFWRYLFYRINRSIADAPIKLWMAEFSMMTRLVRDAILKARTTFPFLRAEMGYVGYKMSAVSYFRASRKHGSSHYNFYSMTRFAVAGFLSSSTFPLRGTLYLSLLLGLLYGMWLLIVRPDLYGAAAMASVLSFVLLLISLPMIALYLARTYKDVSGRPIYFVDPENSLL